MKLENPDTDKWGEKKGWGGIFSHKRKDLKFFCGNTPLGSDVHIAVLSRRNFLWKDGVKEGSKLSEIFPNYCNCKMLFLNAYFQSPGNISIELKS